MTKSQTLQGKGLRENKNYFTILYDLEFSVDDFFAFHQYTKYSIDGNNEIANTRRGKINLGSIRERTSAMMNPKSEINPPIPALHHAMNSPINAIRRQATIGINK